MDNTTMRQKQKNNYDEAIELLKIWFFIKMNNFLWPLVVEALEDKINELLEPQSEDWKSTSIGHVQQFEK